MSETIEEHLLSHLVKFWGVCVGFWVFFFLNEASIFTLSWWGLHQYAIYPWCFTCFEKHCVGNMLLNWIKSIPWTMFCSQTPHCNYMLFFNLTAYTSFAKCNFMHIINTLFFIFCLYWDKHSALIYLLKSVVWHIIHGFADFCFVHFIETQHLLVSFHFFSHSDTYLSIHLLGCYHTIFVKNGVSW